MPPVQLFIALFTALSMAVYYSVSHEREPRRDRLTVPVSVFILYAPDVKIVGDRVDEQEILRVFSGVNNIWAAAAIIVEVMEIRRLRAPSAVLADTMNGDFASFRSFLNARDDPTPSSQLKFYYVPGAGIAKGVTEEDSIFISTGLSRDEIIRVSAHEAGHALGLKHTISDTDRLMYPGSDGTTLSEGEVNDARKGALRITGGDN